MPGTNAGTGYPLTLRCAKCKAGRSGYRRHGTHLEATGRTRPTLHQGYRQTDRRVEYHCLDCGHVGWSQHSDAERLLRRLEANGQPAAPRPPATPRKPRSPRPEPHPQTPPARPSPPPDPGQPFPRRPRPDGSPGRVGPD